MKSVTDALRTLLATGSFVLADLYTFNLVGGLVMRLTTADRDITVSGQAWVSTGPFVDVAADGSGRAQKSVTHQKIGLDVDTRTVSVMPRALHPVTGLAYPDRIGSQPFLAAVAAGALDGCEVQIDRAYWPTWPNGTAPLGLPTGIIAADFAGRVAGVDFDRGQVNITLHSHLELLTQQMPRNVYGPSCNRTLFDAGCGLSAANFARAGTVSAVKGQNAIVSAIAAPPGSGTYTLGRIVFSSGLNVGSSRMVRSWDKTAGAFLLIAPLPFAIQVGDGFTAYPGCDKMQATCTKFGNLANFGGTPYVPSFESAV